MCSALLRISTHSPSPKSFLMRNIQRDRFIKRTLGDAQILQEFFPVLPPFSFSNILRDGYRSSLHLRNQTKVSALRYTLEQSQDEISKLDRLLPHFQLLERRDILLSRHESSFFSPLLFSNLYLLTSSLQLLASPPTSPLLPPTSQLFFRVPSSRSCSRARSASTIILASSSNRTFGSHPKSRLALLASPMRRSTSVGR